MKASAREDAVATAYVDQLTRTIGRFDGVVLDSDPELHVFAQKIIKDKLSPIPKIAVLQTCMCGSYEELKNARAFGLRKIQNGHCVRCNTILETREMEVLISRIDWPTVSDFSFSPKWVGTDLRHFLDRQTVEHKISKRAEPCRFIHSGLEFGIRYQVVWAALLAYVANREQDMEITLHYVHKVQDKAFFVASLARMMQPLIKFHLHSLPIVWIEKAPLITECRSSHIKLLGKCINTSRKDLKVSLPSWRY